MAYLFRHVAVMPGRSRFSTIIWRYIDHDYRRKQKDQRRADFEMLRRDGGGCLSIPARFCATSSRSRCKLVAVGWRGTRRSRALPNEFVLGLRSATVDAASRRARHFRTTPELRINAQARYDLDVAERTGRYRIDREVEPRPHVRHDIFEGSTTRSEQQHKTVRLFCHRVRLSASDRLSLHCRIVGQAVLRGCQSPCFTDNRLSRVGFLIQLNLAG